MNAATTLISFVFILCYATSLPTAATPAISLPRERPEHLTPREQARTILECLYRGQPDSALVLARAFEEERPGDPLPLIITARVMRETLSVQDDDKKLIEESAQPIQAILKRAIAICNERLDADDDNDLCRFYRGWSWMFKAQLDALSANYWSAGRSAKKGKKDLERFLEHHPGDPDASGILGTFLYFADTLPTVIKIIKSLFLIPGGDRERGLELLRYASSHRGMLTIDHTIILSAVYTIFDGRFEDGIRSFASLLKRYPSYLRLVEPIGVAAALHPREIRAFQALQAGAVERHLARNAGEADLPTIHRIAYHRAYSEMLYNPPGQAIEAFEKLIAGAPERPDWIMPLSMINLGMLYANTSRPEQASRMFETIINNDGMRRFHDVAREMLASLDESEGALSGPYPQMVAALYDGRLAEARALLERCELTRTGTVYCDFYRGDLELLSGDLDAAEHSYRLALDRDIAEYAQVYQMFAAARLAELYGLKRDFDTAESLLDEALHFYHREFLIDMLLKGRKRFYKNLAAYDPAQGPQPPYPGTAPLLPAMLLTQ